MQPNHVHQSIAQQIDHMKPDHLRPGVDIVMVPVDETTLAITFVTRKLGQVSVRVRLTPADLYEVLVVYTGEDGEGRRHEYDGVFCDQLGELCFGTEAKPWTQKFGHIEDGDGNIVAEF